MKYINYNNNITSQLVFGYIRISGMEVNGVENSLKRLNIDYLDILLLHRPDASIDPIEVAKYFNKLYKNNKVKSFGVPNMNAIQKHLDVSIGFNYNYIQFIHQ